MSDVYYMNIALDLAKVTLGQTSPNPVVGAVVVKDNEILGMGAHLKAGEAHAEVIALNMAKEAANQSTLYVTLEPCSHVGRTGACVDEIIKSKIKKVVIATIDSNEKVCGRGIRMLKEAGVEVVVGVCEEEARELNKMFFKMIEKKRPFITVKTATSLDGKTTTQKGESKWISSEESRKDVHLDRRKHDSILVGIETVLVDDPLLTVRLNESSKQPIRIVLDTHLRTPLTCQLVVNNDAPTWIFVGGSVSEARLKKFDRLKHVKIIKLSAVEINLLEVMDKLTKENILSVYVEGGATIHGAFLKAGLVDEYVNYLAPILIGGKSAATTFSGDGIDKLSDALSFEVTKVKHIGIDLKIIARRKEVNDVYRNS